ncbi:hypothetical protein Sjap_016598 [Stephania japonica]|uniref:CASP-like protein n=1 Tax=Stephania japonica TaxID=461633 RepID=A0AAP0ILB1_9MAGN
MATKAEQNPPLKTQTRFLVGHAALRTLGIAAALIAIGLMTTGKQAVELLGFQLVAKYSYSPILRYFVIISTIACGLSALSLGCFLYSVRSINPGRKNYFTIFVIDLVVVGLALTGSSAATAMGYVGRYGDSHAGWMPICGTFGRFCDRMTVSVAFSFFAAVVYMGLAVWSAWIASEAHLSNTIY